MDLLNNLGGVEIIILATLALLLFGPQDMMKAMRTFSGYLYRFQQSWREISAILQQDLLSEETLNTPPAQRPISTTTPTRPPEISAASENPAHPTEIQEPPHE